MANNCGCGVPFIIEEKEKGIKFALGDPVINEGDYDTYSGETVVTPKIKDEQVLGTAGKLVKDDITVKQVPVYSVTNPAGGVTYYIGED